VIPGLLLDYEL